jgi:type IV secretion system protein VirB2
LLFVRGGFWLGGRRPLTGKENIRIMRWHQIPKNAIFDNDEYWRDFSCQPNSVNVTIRIRGTEMPSIVKPLIFVAAFLLAFLPAVVFGQELSTDPLSTDPQGSGVVVNAMRWMQGTLLGTVATVAAVIAIASIGFLMLTGRINWRHGAAVILGCFILFGAASIVAGIQSAASFSGSN